MKTILKFFAIALCVFVIFKPSSPCLNRDISEKLRNSASMLFAPSSFSSKILKTIEQMNTDKNVILSPTSIYLLLFMVYTLTSKNEDNVEQLQKLLSLPHENDALNYVAYVKILEYYDMVNETILENRVYYDSSIKPYDHMKQLLCRELEVKDFTYNLTDSIESINAWVRQLTHNSIQKGIEQSKLDFVPQVLLLNLLYFKGSWLSVFNEELTRKFVFTDENGQQTSTDMMLKQSEYSVWNLKNLASELIEIPYKKNFSMFILLPKRNQKGLISKIVSQIDDKFVKNMMTQPKNMENLLLFLPKFSIENEFNLLDMLEKMQVDIKAMNLENLSPDGNGLFLKNAFHVSKIQVDEKGTEAAAISVGVIERSVTSFQINRPFIYFICDMSTQSVLFEGIYRKPDNLPIIPMSRSNLGQGCN